MIAKHIPMLQLPADYAIMTTCWVNVIKWIGIAAVSTAAGGYYYTKVLFLERLPQGYVKATLAWFAGWFLTNAIIKANGKAFLNIEKVTNTTTIIGL
jgi:hypothetical protein